MQTLSLRPVSHGGPSTTISSRSGRVPGRSELRVGEHPGVDVAVAAAEVIDRIPDRVTTADDVGELRVFARARGTP